jgi:hypothetical protein
VTDPLHAMSLEPCIEQLWLALCAFGLAQATAGQGQNLVPNGDFEQYTLCPSNISQIERAVGWTTIGGTPDYFNACNSNDSVDVPSSAIGYQHAASGSGYAGVVTYRPSVQFRESLQTQLTTALIPGVPIHVSLKVSPGGFGNDVYNSPDWASSGIGIRFSTVEIPPVLLVPNSAVLFLDDVLDDTSTWRLLAATYVPDSAYQYVQVGNFFDDANTLALVLDSTALLSAAYAFVDDVCVGAIADCQEFEAVGDIECSDWRMVNTGFENELTVDLSCWAGATVSIRLFDAAGRLCLNSATSDGTVRLNCSGIVPGYYTLLLGTRTGVKAIKLTRTQ